MSRIFTRALMRALAAVLEGDLGRNIGLARSVVERLDQRRIAVGDEPAADLQGARDLAVVGVEFLVQDQKALDLRTGHHLVGGQRVVHFGDMLFEHVVDERMAGELLV